MAEAPSPAAAYVPRLPIRRTPHFFENDAAPREWSVCSWERTIADSDAGSTPADSSRSAMSRAPRPASIRMRVSPDSMTVVLPELPDPRTLNRTVSDLTRRPCHGEPAGGTLGRERWRRDARPGGDDDRAGRAPRGPGRAGHGGIAAPAPDGPRGGRGVPRGGGRVPRAPPQGAGRAAEAARAGGARGSDGLRE